MSPRSKKEYIEVTSLRYKKASRKRKSAILDEFCATCRGVAEGQAIVIKYLLFAWLLKSFSNLERNRKRSL